MFGNGLDNRKRGGILAMYRYDKQKLQFVRILWHKKLAISLVVILLISWMFVLTIPQKGSTESEIMVMIHYNKFSEEKLLKMINDLHFRFPDIVYAQAVLETNNFKSNIFMENHNLFGMKEALLRVTTSKGTQNSHAYYNSWMESVYDYALYYSVYLSSITTEEEYFSYLSQFYAQDKNYVTKLKEIIRK